MRPLSYQFGNRPLESYGVRPGGSHNGGQAAFVLQPILPYNMLENLQTSEVYISKIFDPNDKIR